MLNQILAFRRIEYQPYYRLAFGIEKFQNKPHVNFSMVERRFLSLDIDSLPKNILLLPTTATSICSIDYSLYYLDNGVKYTIENFFLHRKFQSHAYSCTAREVVG